MATGRKDETAKVTLDARTADKIASTLEGGLRASGAYEVGGPGPSPQPGPDQVRLDPDQVMRFVRHLRSSIGSGGGGGGAKKRPPTGGAKKAPGGKKR